MCCMRSGKKMGLMMGSQSNDDKERAKDIFVHIFAVLASCCRAIAGFGFGDAFVCPAL